MSKHGRRLKLTLGIALISAIVLAVGVGYVSGYLALSGNATSSKTGGGFGAVGGISGLPAAPDFEIEGSNTTNLAVTQAGSVSGSVTLQILQPDPVKVFINDLGYNGSSTLPTGISVTILANGAQFSAERVSVIQSVLLSQNPLTTTSDLASLPVTYRISVGNTVQPGTYSVVLYFVSFHNDGTQLYSGYMYTVVLNVT